MNGESRSRKQAVAALLFALAASPSMWAEELPPIQTVFLILMENHPWPLIKGSTNAPYLNNTLLPMASYCEGYINVPGLYPSLPNYLWLEGGTNFGVYDDNEPIVNHQSSTNHLVTLLKNSGISWKTYQEDIGGTEVPLTAVAEYVPRHNPFVYFDDVTGTNNSNYPYGIAHIRPYNELGTDLTNNTVARYNFITPNLCHDMHNACAPLYDSIQMADNWLASEVPKILGSQAYRDGGALFITWDECGNPVQEIGMIVLSPLAKGGGYVSTNYYTHSSTLRTMQEIFSVRPFLGDAVNAADLSDLFKPQFRISRITKLDGNQFQLSVAGVVTNVPLVLQVSTSSGSWTPVCTNLPSQATFTTVITNAPGNSPGGDYYRFVEAFP